MKIVFVCTGNTCRSPMAEAIAKDIVKKRNEKDIKVFSYGLCVNPLECETDKNALAALKDIGVPVRKKKSKQITARSVNGADYVVTMTEKQKKMLPYSNVYTLDELTGAGEIPDPYGGNRDIYDLTAFKLNIAVQSLINKLCEGRK